MTTKTFISALTFALTTLSASGQSASEPSFEMTCQDGGDWSNDRGGRFCEIRELTLDAGKTLTVDARTYGGISVRGWSGPTVRVRAKVQSWAKSDAAAQAQVKAIKINSQNNRLRAEAPGDDKTWAVNYEIFVPRQTALSLQTLNGGISLQNLQNDVNFEVTNGGISLSNVGGHVKGHTTNGGLSINLAGPKWEGKGLDVATTNGGITWRVPRNYSAELFTSTNMGAIQSDLPTQKSGMIGGEVAAKLGQGGAPVRAVTTHGGIRVRQAED